MLLTAINLNVFIEKGQLKPQSLFKSPGIQIILIFQKRCITRNDKAIATLNLVSWLLYI